MKSFLILYVGRLLGPICLQIWVSDLLIQVIWEIDTQTNEHWLSKWPTNL